MEVKEGVREGNKGTKYDRKSTRINARKIRRTTSLRTNKKEVNEGR